MYFVVIEKKNKKNKKKDMRAVFQKRGKKRAKKC